jgi:proteasome regulatory subunit
MSQSPSLPDTPRLELDPDMSPSERLVALRDHYRSLHAVHEELETRLEETREQSRELREEAERLERTNECLKSAALYVATVEEIDEENDEVVIKQHGNNQEILTDLPTGAAENLSPGDRVAVDDSFGLQTALDADTDARAQAMEVDTSPEVSYADIGGLDEQLTEVREAVEEPLIKPDQFETVGIDPPSGVLLHGPPGTGKTMLAKAVANETDATFIKMAGSELVHKFIGEGAKLVRDLFEVAREREPAVLFIDEIDAIAAKRTDSKTSGDAEVQRTMMQLLAEMDGFEDRGEVRIIAATNRFDMLDRAILRPGRFDRLIEVPEPTEEGREEIFRIHTREMNVASDVDFGALAVSTDELSGADIKAICTEAGMFAIRDDREEVRQADFEQAIEKVEESGDGTDVVTSDGYADYAY